MDQPPAEIVTFADGETLFAPGDTARRGFLLVAGRVSLRDAGGRTVFLAAAGDVIGELAALFGRPQDLTARAEGPVRACPVERAQIDRAVARDPESARILARRMLNALHLAPTGAGGGDTVAPDAWSSIRIRPDGEAMLALMARQGVEVPFLPFNVGRAPAHGERPVRTTIHLLLADQQPYNLSRHHFAIEANQSAVMVRDVGSHLGTMVNGVKIGIDQPANVASLRPGDNVLWAGGVNTPFRFVVTVET